MATINTADPLSSPAVPDEISLRFVHANGIRMRVAEAGPHQSQDLSRTFVGGGGSPKTGGFGLRTRAGSAH
jgi:hypothetical protein